MLSIICFSLAGICLAGSIASLVVAIRRKKQIPQRKEDMTRQQKEPANPDANWYLENIYEELRNLSQELRNIPRATLALISPHFYFAIGIIIAIELIILGIIIS